MARSHRRRPPRGDHSFYLPRFCFPCLGCGSERARGWGLGDVCVYRCADCGLLFGVERYEDELAVIQYRSPLVEALPDGVCVMCRNEILDTQNATTVTGVYTEGQEWLFYAHEDCANAVVHTVHAP